MKTMTCRQLAGPCDQEFHANTFEEMMELSKNHGMEMYQKGDKAHVDAMNQMKDQMSTQTPADMQAWMGKMKASFDALPTNG